MPSYKIGIEVDAKTGDSAGKIAKVSSAAGSLDEAMSAGGAGVSGLGGALGGLATPAGAAAAALAVVGGALVATGAHAMALAAEVEGATAKLSGQLNLSTEEAAGLEEVMRSIYRNNFGEDYQDIADALFEVEQQFGRIGGIAPDELQGVTEKAFALRDAFGYDINESVGAVTSLMENFGLTSTEAFDWLTTATQQGLNSSGDLIDTLGEYSVQFGGGRASAEEFYAILEKGNAGGVLGTDKIADAWKEFGIRILDDSKLTKNALDSIGISYDDLKKGMADGSVNQVQAMQAVIDKIDEIEDPIERNRVGVALFGTGWEDAGEKAILALGDTKDAVVETEGATESLNVQYGTTASDIEAATRLWEDALVDVGAELNGLAAVTLPWLAQQMQTFVVPSIGLLAEWISNLQSGQNAWDAFINGLWGLAPDMNWTRSPQAQPLEGGEGIVPPSGREVTPAALAGSAIYQTFYIERGDAETVATSAELGVTRAQRALGQ